jgi:UDP-N-acetylmuramoyl-L-alanyl-D-glutamate--2,6-diaminopimelate ligase
MTIQEILTGVRLRTSLPEDLAVTHIENLEYDSRRVKPGTLFFAFQGKRADGRAFAQSAIHSGARAVASDLPRPADFEGSWIEVEDGRHALAIACRNLYAGLEQRLRITGVTGTNGKTTVTHLVDSILRAAGYTTAMVGTIQYHVAGEIRPAVNTTPESLDLYRIFAELAGRGGTHVTMEVSSHALALGRVYGIRFHSAVFTNLTRDHLDFHHTMEEYFASKQLLFDGCGAPPPAHVAINDDDPYGRRIVVAPESERLAYGLEKGADVWPSRVRSTAQGLEFDMHALGRSVPVRSPLIGKFNLYNILAACCAGLHAGLDLEAIARGVEKCSAVAGRFERVDEGQPFTVVVDYAHTDDALRNVIQAARALAPRRVLTLFGCGGDRDRDKRPLMGAAAAELSDFVVLTSDNPRSEDPLAIMNDAMVGVRRHDVRYIAEPDREKAIGKVLAEAGTGDIVLIAGKGHETYQILKDRTIPFDDRAVARRILTGFGYRRENQ